MFEGVVAGLLNRVLGRYVLNLESENIKLGIVSGHAELTDLQLRPEALFELDLPVEVKAGYIGKISVRIPWTNPYSSPTELTLEDVYVLAGPVTDRPYDARREAALQTAIKRKKLEELDRMTEGESTTSSDPGFLEKLLSAIINNLQVSIQRIHVRYEDKITNPDHPFAFGIMLKMMTAETSDNIGRPEEIGEYEKCISKLVRMQALSCYWNPYLPEHSMVRAKLHTAAWRNLLKNSINSHRIMEEEFDFIVRPISASSKLLLNRDDLSCMPRLMADFVMQELEVLLSRQQFLNMLTLGDSFKMMAVNQQYRRFRPYTQPKSDLRGWWHYAYKSVVNDTIRPYSWQRIKAHRDKYRRYKDLCKQRLRNPDSSNIENQLRQLQDNLDLANILMAREHAKLEYIQESPQHGSKRKKESGGWWRHLFGAGNSDDFEEEEEVVLHSHSNLPAWLGRLSQDERDRMYKAIGYEENANIEHTPQYIAHKINFRLMSCTVSLVNYGKEVLKMSLAQLNLSLQNRPDDGGFRAAAKTESFVVEGVSIEHELVPLITSDIGVYAPSILTQVFSFEFEKNPLHVDADYSAKLGIQPVEIVYDEHAVTEMLAFFQVSNLSVDDIKHMAQQSIGHIADVSRLALQYAIQQHTTLHLSVNMRSPYIVIPEYGTLHRGGNVFVLDFGKLKIESDLQPKNLSLEECTMSEIHSRLYDKFNITVTEVKALLADSGDDWHTAQTKPDSQYHVLPSVGMQFAFFNTVKPDYTHLPQQKLEARLPSVKLSLSDEKLQMLADFFKHIPMPHSSSMMGLDDSVDGHLEPTLPVMDSREVQLQPSNEELKSMQQAVLKNSVSRKSSKKKNRKNRFSSTLSNESEYYYSASDNSDEEPNEWAKGLDVPAVDDHTSATNTINIFARFVMGEIVVLISKSSDKIDTPYLMLRIDRVCAECALTVHGIAIQASLGEIQLIDKIHLGSSGEYLEMLGSKYDTDLLSVVYRKVSPSCPDFDQIYHSVEQGAVIKVSSLKLTFDRAATLYLTSFIQGLLLSVQGNMETNLRKSTSTILSGPTCDPHVPEPPSFIQRLTSNSSEGLLGFTRVHLVAKMDQLSIRMCDHENEFADVFVQGLEGKLVMKATRTIMQARLTDMSVEDLAENTLYPRVLSIDDDNLFDFKLVSYVQVPPKLGIRKAGGLDSSVRLRIGRVQGVLLYKFLSEMKSFLEPFMNPELTESYKMAAQQAVHSKIQDAQDQGSRFSVNLDVRAPTLLIPQHSESSNVLLVQLGNLNLRNSFRDTDLGGGVTQSWDHFCLRLDAMQVIRGKLTLNGHTEYVHVIVEPISFNLDLKRALPPHRTDLSYDISGKLQTVEMRVTQNDVKVMMAIMRDNMSEVSSKHEKIDESELTPMTDRPVESMETTTPVVEIEEPLLSAPEVSELVRQTKFSFVLDGMTLTLLQEEDDPLAPSSPVKDEGDGLARFEIGQIDVAGMLNNDSSLEVKLSLASISLDDIREHSNLAVKRLVLCGLRSQSQYDPVAAMVELIYKQTGEGNKHIDANLDTVRLNVCVPYLLSITRFFTDAFRSPEDHHNVPPSPIILIPKTPNPDQASRPARPKSLHPLTVEETSSAAFTICGRFKQLEVVLFAEPTQTHSRVIVLKANTVLDYFSLQDRQHLEAKVRQMQIMSCVYGLPCQNPVMVLYPCDVEFTRVQESAESGLNMSAKLSDLLLNVSSTTIRIVLDVMEVIKQGTPQPAKETHDPCLGLTEHFDLWHTRSVTSEKYTQQEKDEEAKKQEVAKAYPLLQNTPPSENLKVEMNKVRIVFEVENLDFHVPRMCLETGVQASIHDWSRQLNMNCEVQLQMSYYNEQLAVWEPLLEPAMDAENNYRPWEVLLKVVRARSHPLSCEGFDRKTKKEDEIDGEVHYLMSKVRARTNSSETDSDSDSEMTVIKPNRSRQGRLGSDRSYDSVSHPGSSIQGDSDSEPELMSTISSNLDSMFTSDSSEADLSAADDDIFDHSDKPVFLTARGPIHVNSEGGEDTTDGLPGFEEEESSLCTYLLVDSTDLFLLNITPHAIDVISEVTETLLRSSSTTLRSVRDLPGFELYNQLDIEATVTPPADIRMSPDYLHNVHLNCKSDPLPDTAMLVNVETAEDEVDGLRFLTKTLNLKNKHLVTGTVTHSEDQPDPVVPNNTINVLLNGFDELFHLNYEKATSRLLPLTPCKNDTNYLIVYNVDVKHGRKVVTMRSPLQLINHLTIPLEVYCLTKELQTYSGTSHPGLQRGEYTQLKTIDPDELLNIPLYVAYHCRLFVAPVGIGYEKCAKGIWWQQLSMLKDRSRHFSCLSKSQGEKPFILKVTCERGTASCGSLTSSGISPHYTLHVYPPVVLHNLLPYDIQFSLEGSAISLLSHGENTPLYTADLICTPRLKLQVCEYHHVDWMGSLELGNELEEFKAITMESDVNVDGQNKQLSLSIHINCDTTMDLYLYSPYWLVNKTGLPIMIRGSRSETVYHNDVSQDPLLFRFKKHKRKKAKLRVYNSKWSHSFSLDTVSTSGVIICNDKERNRKYHFLLQIQMSQLHLTKMVTILPYFLVVNRTSHSLRYMEENEQADLWMDLTAHQCTPFWPATDSLKMYVKHLDSNVSSQHFYIHKPHTSTLRMDKGTALCVEVAGGTESSLTITFLPYEHGDAPVRVDNICEDVFVKLHQKKQSQVSLLAPCQSVLYTWDDPTSERTLMWNVYNRKKPSYPAFLCKDGCGSVQLSIQTVRRSSLVGITNAERPKEREKKRNGSDHIAHDSSSDDDSDTEHSRLLAAPLPRGTKTAKVVVYWVSFLEGLQRVLLFTQDQKIARMVKKLNDAEPANLALFVSMGGIGVSLINGRSEEVAYVSASSCPAIWEVEVKGKWKALSTELAVWMEERWRVGDRGKVFLEDSIEADLETMEMKKPFIGGLRRLYNPALFVQYKQSQHRTYINTKLHRLQIDNQLCDAYFPTVLYPSPVPSYVVKKSGPRPFLEMAVMRQQVPEKGIDTFKYVKLLMQEFDIQLDKGFVLSVYDIFANKQEVKKESAQLHADLAFVHGTLLDVTAIQAAARPKRIMFEYLHLSPLKMRVSFSLDGRVHAVLPPEGKSVKSDIIDFFLNSVGATLTEIKEVELKMAFFERIGVTVTPGQLLAEVKSHYMSQALQQGYVLLLGLDVLGNPYGLVKDFTQGLGDFFYEPFLGSIQGPDKFAEGLVKGVQSLLGHTVGSAAGSVALITGSLGKTLALLSFDKDYQLKRNRHMNQMPKHLPETLYLSGKGFVMGVMLGLSGVVASPIRGIQEEGLEGFFKGMGKGLMGLLTKPAAGAVDMVSMAFDGVRRAAEMGENVVVRIRIPRHIHPDLGVKPYSRYEAVGARILRNLAKGKYAVSDLYWAHAALSRDERANVCLLTNRRLLLLEKSRFWGDWEVEFDVPLEDMLEMPKLQEDRLQLRIRKDETGFSPLSSVVHDVRCNDADVLRWIQRKIERIININRNTSC